MFYIPLTRTKHIMIVSETIKNTMNTAIPPIVADKYSIR